jgi:superfamily II DNA or RNA helicase
MTLRTDGLPGFVRVTGDEDSLQRDAAQRAFTQTDTTRIIFLTMAGSESLNLQEAAGMIFFDLPWSAGDYIQLIGRAIRIGSPMERMVAVHMISKGPQGQKTIDMHVSKTLDKKMALIEQTLGGQLKSEQDQMITDKSSDANDLFRALLDDARQTRKV